MSVRLGAVVSPEWLSAIGTVGAFAVSMWLLWRGEVDRRQLRDERARDRVRRVWLLSSERTVYINTPVHRLSSGDPIRQAVEQAIEERAQRPAWAVRQGVSLDDALVGRVRIVNDGEEPIFGPVLSMMSLSRYIKTKKDELYTFYDLPELPIIVRPGDDITVGVVVNSSLHRSVEERFRQIELNLVTEGMDLDFSEPWNVELQFLDAGGVGWARRHTGELRRLNGRERRRLIKRLHYRGFYMLDGSGRVRRRTFASASASSSSYASSGDPGGVKGPGATAALGPLGRDTETDAQQPAKDGGGKLGGEVGQDHDPAGVGVDAQQLETGGQSGDA